MEVPFTSLEPRAVFDGKLESFSVDSVEVFDSSSDEEIVQDTQDASQATPAINPEPKQLFYNDTKNDHYTALETMLDEASQTDLLSWVFGGNGPTDTPVLIDAADPERYLTVQQLESMVKKLICGFKEAGSKAGDCVCAVAFNDITYSALYLGTVGFGGRFTGVNPSYTVPELAHHLQICKAKVLVVEPRMLETALSAAAIVDLPRSNIYVLDVHDENPYPDIKSWTTLLQHGESDWDRVEDPSNTVASYICTSGSTGLPKAAMFTHGFILSQAISRLNNPALLEVSKLIALPAFTAFSYPVQHSSNIRQRQRTYVMRRWDMRQFLDCIERYQIVETFLPPPLVVAIPNSGLATKQGLQSLRQITTGGALFKHSNQKHLVDLLHPEACLQTAYGMTELGWATGHVFPSKPVDDSQGTLFPGYQARLIDDDGLEITKDDQRGEILVKARHVTIGYIDNAEATAEAFTPDGYIRTGDVGYAKDGKLFVIDRKKHLIKVNCWQVSPAEVENVILEHPGVLDAAAVGIPDTENASDTVRLYAVVKDGYPLTLAHVRDYARGRMAKYKMPTELELVDSIPRNAGGKVLRHVIRDQAMQKSAEESRAG